MARTLIPEVDYSLKRGLPGLLSLPTRVLWTRNIHLGTLASPSSLVCDLGHQISFFYEMGYINNYHEMRILCIPVR